MQADKIQQQEAKEESKAGNGQAVGQSFKQGKIHERKNQELWRVKKNTPL